MHAKGCLLDSRRQFNCLASLSGLAELPISLVWPGIAIAQSQSCAEAPRHWAKYSWDSMAPLLKLWINLCIHTYFSHVLCTPQVAICAFVGLTLVINHRIYVRRVIGCGLLRHLKSSTSSCCAHLAWPVTNTSVEIAYTDTPCDGDESHCKQL